VHRLLVATSNPGKLEEITPILAGIPFEILTLTAFPDVVPPSEDENSFAGNARAKALYYAQATGELTVAEDSGLAIDALGGAPGIESARLGGAHATYPEKFALIYNALRSKNALQSPARYVCAAALAWEGRVLFETEGAIEGRIAAEPRGAGGFGYDPIFFYPPFGATFGETGDRKLAVSHRGQAFRALRHFLTATFRFGEWRPEA
jgi:XTP/dITP diphosphohydrolase